MNETTNIEIKIDLPVPTILKSVQKEKLVGELKKNILDSGATSAELKDSFYMDYRSAEAIAAISLVFGVVAPYLGAASLALAIYSLVRKKKGYVMIKKKDGNYFKVKEGTTEDEIKKQVGLESDTDESKES